jgi:hypothetical protein
MLDRARALWQLLPLPYKIGGVIVVIALLITTTNRLTNYYNDRQFQKAIQAEKDLREVDKKRGDDAEAKAIAAESEKLKFQVALELAGKDGDRAIKRVEDADKRYLEELQRIDADVDIVERCKRLCAEFKLKDCECRKPTENNSQ